MPDIVDRGGVLELMKSNMPVIDVLPPKEHDKMRLAGSVGIWLRQLDSDSMAAYSKTDPVVVYCHDHL